MFEKMTAGPDGWSDWLRPVNDEYRAQCCSCGHVHKMEFRIDGNENINFRVAREAAANAIQEPVGWKLVPLEATEKMRRDGAAKIRDFYTEKGVYPRTQAMWAAMLAASPREQVAPVHAENVEDKYKALVDLYTISKRECDEHLRLKNALVLKAYPAMDAVDRIRKWIDAQKYENDLITVVQLRELLGPPTPANHYEKSAPSAEIAASPEFDHAHPDSWKYEPKAASPREQVAPYRCGVCRSTDSTRYQRCDHPGCPDGRRPS